MNRTRFSSPIRDDEIPVHLHPDGGAYPWEVEQDQWYLWAGFGGFAPCVIPLPRGYRTDGPSIPWFAQGLVAKDGPAWPAALFHDVACSAELFPVGCCNTLMSDAMHDWGTVPPGDQTRIEMAIGAFCWLTFRSHKAREVASDRHLVVQASRRIWREHGPLFEGFGKIEEVSPGLLG